MNLNEQQMSIVNDYCKNNLKKLKSVCNPLIYQKGIPDAEHDEIYSQAMDVLIDSVKRFNETKDCKFHTFFVGNMKRTLYDWTRDRTRYKRCNVVRDRNNRVIKKDNKPIYITDVSLNHPNENGDEFVDCIQSDYCLEDEVIVDNSISDKTREYMSKLSKKQLQIAGLIMDGFPKNEIKSKLGLSDGEYNMYINDMRSFEKTIVLRKSNKHSKKEEDAPMQTQTREKSKPKEFSIEAIIDNMNSGDFNYEHPQQRESGQWTGEAKGNLVSDILQGNRIPELVFAEQVMPNGTVITWNIDGKQRSTVVHDFVNNGFRISKSVHRWMIPYQSRVLDEDGNPLSDNNIPVYENKEFDIRRKLFKDLPVELQKMFTRYTFNCSLYLNCSDDDIAYHISRHNEGRRMNVSQKGLTNIRLMYVNMIKEIAAMSFFKDNGDFCKHYKDGGINRVILEGIMSTNYLNDWNPSAKEMFTYIDENVSEDVFEEFTDLINRLDSIVTDEVSSMFSSKDFMVWIYLFKKFTELELDDDSLFINFMSDFETLKAHKIDGKTYKDVTIRKDTGKAKSFKDRSVLFEVVGYMEALMTEYLHIENKETATSIETPEKTDGKAQSEDFDALKFIKTEINQEVENDDIELYQEVLDDYCKVDDPVLGEYKPALTALMAFGFQKEVDVMLGEWLEHFANQIIKNGASQVENYITMRDKFMQYLAQNGGVA